MEAKSRRIQGTEGREVIVGKCDRISSLPDSILHHIFSFLPTKIATQTTILSKRWQKLLISLPYIDLEEHRESHMESFMNFVDNFLLHHDKSSKITRFRLSGEPVYDLSHVNAWISAAVGAGVEELDLQRLYFPIDKGALTSCLFSCNSLVTLKLDLGYLIWFPEFFSFPKMKTMHLSIIIFPDNFIHMLEYNCPNLEKLFLEFCSIATNSPPSSHTFQYLIADDHILGNFSHLNDVYVDFSSCRYTSRYICGHLLGKFFRRLYNVQALHMSHSSIKLMTSESYLWDHLPTFHNLKRLELNLETIMKVDELGLMASLLKCSPILESLHIVFSKLNIKHANSMLRRESELKPEEFPSLCVAATARTLKWIRMDNFRATKNQRELVRLFLASSQFLETLIVQVEKYVVKSPSSETFFILLVDGLPDPTSVRQELLQLPRLSTNCVLRVV